MAFIPASSAFLGTRTTAQLAKCRLDKGRKAATTSWRMTAVSPVPADTTAEELAPIPTIPPFTRVPLTKGQTFQAVRFAKDDFEASTYFQGLTGNGVKVAVIDTGCDASHPALKNRIESSLCRNYTTGSRDDWDDRDGHGTHCAGIVLAEQNNAPMYGVAPGATLVVKKVLGQSDPGLRLTNTPIADAIKDAADEGCRVMSISIGMLHSVRVRPSWRYPNGIARVPFRLGRGPRFVDGMDALYEACMYALSKKCIIVVSAGNSGRGQSVWMNSFATYDGETNTITPPASYGGVITVASHDDNGVRSDFSSRGGELDFMAPGEVISTWPMQGVPKSPHEEDLTREMQGYCANKGTSMSTPLVAGLAALLIEAGDRAKSGNLDGLSAAIRKDIEDTGFQARNLYEVREMLRALSEHPNMHDRESGYGRLSRAYEYVEEVVEQNI